jgi:hypothetical protein
MHDDANLRMAGRGYAIIRDVTEALAIVWVFGDVDFSVSWDLDAAIVESDSPARTVVANMAECRYLDASVVTVLLRAHRRLGDRFRIVAPAGCATRRLLGIVQLADKLWLHASLPSALHPGPQRPLDQRRSNSIPLEMVRESRKASSKDLSSRTPIRG